MTDRPLLGMDASSKVVAYTGDGNLPQGSLEYPESWSADRRRLNMFMDVRKMGRHLSSNTVVALEEPLSLKNPKTNVVLALAAGAVWAALTDAGLTVIWVNVASWKKDTVGKGNASKAMVREWCIANPDFKKSIRFYDEHPDLFDAWAIYVYAKRHLVDSSRGC